MKITVDGLTDFIYDNTEDMDIWSSFDEQVGTYFQILRDNLTMKIYYSTYPVDVFDTDDIEMISITNPFDGSSADIVATELDTDDVYDFLKQVENLLDSTVLFT